MIDYGFGVSLGSIDSKHIEIIRAWRNDPRIYKWCRQNSLISDVQQERWFESQAKDPTIKMYGIFDASSKFVGVCGLTSIDLYSRRAEFSLYVAPGLHNRGTGSAALRTLVSHGFNDLGLNCIWGESFDTNPAAAMFEKVGFKKEGTRREFYFKNGRFTDAHLYSILASEWRARPC